MSRNITCVTISTGQLCLSGYGDPEACAIIQEFQSKELPNSRIQPDRRWFGNTRVVGQKQLEQFREEMSTKVCTRLPLFTCADLLLADALSNRRTHMLWKPDSPLWFDLCLLYRSMTHTQSFCAKRSCHSACSRTLKLKHQDALPGRIFCKLSHTERLLVLVIFAKNPSLVLTLTRSCSARLNRLTRSELSITDCIRHAA